MARRELGCHYQTLLYRERKGQLHPIKIRNRKFYAIGEIKKLKAEAPVKSKPHYTRRLQQGGEALIVRVEPEQPVSLWTKIVKFIRACVAK